MILKGIDDKTSQLASLEALLTTAQASARAGIQRDIAAIRAGIKAEQEAAYYIDFDLRDSERTAVIHDLRLEVDGRVAQIDHVVIHKTLTVFVLETKHIASGLKITEDGEFLRWNDYKKTYEGMASPLAQNERHLAVLKDAFQKIELPTRLGMRLDPVFRSFIVVSPQARIDRPKKFDTSCVIKSDGLIEAMEKSFDRAGVLSTFGAAARLVSSDTVSDIGRQLVGLHRPSPIDYTQKYQSLAAIDAGPSACEPAVEVRTQVPDADRFACRRCGKADLTIQHGRYGYYFKCSSCDGNTPIKIDCGKEGHKERLRKQGPKFFRECAECGSSSLFFENAS
ncbi:MAG: NERD domain-containing protein [Rhodocyclaceae bacterium]|nr:NERD domain-containing protein [Rhodocyclaceae bacterium]MCP5340545.1 NERD domain-containing protein [Nevskiaceae bacterium]